MRTATTLFALKLTLRPQTTTTTTVLKVREDQEDSDDVSMACVFAFDSLASAYRDGEEGGGRPIAAEIVNKNGLDIIFDSTS